MVHVIISGSYTTLRAESHFVFLNEKEKKRLHLNHIKPLSSRVVNLVFPLQTGFFECEHPFIDKPLAINEPAVASARLVGLGPKLYQSKKVQQGSHSIHAGIFFSTPKGSAGRLLYTQCDKPMSTLLETWYQEEAGVARINIPINIENHRSVNCLN